ncbi:MAG: hypothetical protein ACLFSN_00940 [Candidatus Woesearchaeota archaeon]
MMMKQALIATIYGELHVHSLNVFDIGTNKEYIDYGRMSHEMASALSTRLASLERYLSENDIAVRIGLAIPGHVVDMIADHDEDLLQRLATFISTNNVELLSMPYYAGSMHVLSGEELKAQVEHHNHVIREHLGASPSVFFTAEDHLSAEHVSALSNAGLSSCIDSRALEATTSTKPTLIALDISAFEDPSSIPSSLDTDSLEGVDVISSSFSLDTVSSVESSTVLSPMQEHIISELKGLYPHVSSTGDEDLLSHWRYLAHHKAVFHTDAAGELKKSQYDHYMDMMNIFNDIAHKIRSVELSKNGVFLTEPEVADSPSHLLQTMSCER